MRVMMMMMVVVVMVIVIFINLSDRREIGSSIGRRIGMRGMGGLAGLVLTAV